MKLKYELEKSENNELVIRESSVLDKKDHMAYTILCEQKFDGTVVKAAIEKSRDTLISALRTINFFPQDIYIAKIADVVAELYGQDGKKYEEIILDDCDFLTKTAKEKAADEEKLLEDIEDDIEEETIGIDDLLEDDDVITNIKTTIQVADDDSVDLDKDTSLDDLIN